jgi:hypothetical protein
MEHTARQVRNASLAVNAVQISVGASLAVTRAIFIASSVTASEWRTRFLPISFHFSVHNHPLISFGAALDSVISDLLYNVGVNWLALPLLIFDVLGSYICPVTGHPEGFSWFPQSLGANDATVLRHRRQLLFLSRPSQFVSYSRYVNYAVDKALSK